MKANNQTLTDTGTQRSADDPLILAVPARGLVETQLDELKERLLKPMAESIANTALARELAWAANEAAAMAWCTVCPVLVLPELLEEKVHAVLQRWERQQRIQCARV